ncbi:MAG: RIP metalloprotease RseP, partial [Flammeovirgaceae bacterium]|nr:RIP metalloprotease RseP [Flammeovirgaceae bacterium]MDW8288794.1 RIP metalloprotease RseP [Flammeovirgaceae bacterium]
DTTSLTKAPQSWEFRSKPAWQRLLVMLGGIIFNVILGICIFVGMIYVTGEEYLTREEANKHGIYVNELGKEIGLQTGDKIIKINGKDFHNFNDVKNPLLLMETNAYYTVLRKGDSIHIPIPSDFIDRLSREKGKYSNFVSPLFTFYVGDIRKGSPAEKAGLQKEDRIVAINGQEITYFQLFKEEIQKNAGKPILLTVVDKSGVKRELSLTVSPEGIIGFVPVSELEYATIDYTFIEAIPKGIYSAFQTVWLQVKAFGKIFKGEMSLLNSLGGPVEIAQAYGGELMWERFWMMTGFLSMVLAFMNLLPIPALDGGHVVFLCYEMVAGNPPSNKFLEISQKVGMVILLMLMIFVLGKGILSLFF